MNGTTAQSVVRELDRRTNDGIELRLLCGTRRPTTSRSPSPRSAAASHSSFRSRARTRSPHSTTPRAYHSNAIHALAARPDQNGDQP
jgi:hypothetical protein